MKDCVSKKYKMLLDLFSLEYKKIVSYMEEEAKNELLEMMPIVFSKWLYSTTVKNNTLSPINMLIGLDNKIPSEETFSLFINKEDEVIYKHIEFSIENHPIINDLKILLDFCKTSKTIKDGSFLKEDKDLLFSKISYCFSYYLEYLFILSLKLELLEPFPSIHIKKYQSTSNYNEFFTKNNSEILKILVEAACDITYEYFNNILELDNSTFPKNFFFNFLFSDCHIDTIIIKFYNYLDIDIKELWENIDEAINTEDEETISSCYSVSVLLDKWFLFPMSVFFGLIRPTMVTTLNLLYVINNLNALILSSSKIGKEIFYPGTFYLITPLGEEIFNLQKRKISTKKYSQIKLKEHISTLNLTPKIKNQPKNIFIIKITDKFNNDKWKLMEIDEKTKLDYLAADIALIMNSFSFIEPDFVFILKDSNNFPIKYSPLESKRSINKTSNKKISDLKLKTNTVFELNFNKFNSFLIEVLDQKPAKPYILYPRIINQSYLFRLEEDFIDFTI